MTEADRLSAFASVPHGLAELVVLVCNQVGRSLRSIRADGQHRDGARIRRQIALEARWQGYSYPAIGRALNRDHSTIMHLVKTPGRWAQ